MGERTDEVTTVHRFERTNPEEVYEVEETAREVPDRRTGVEDLGFGASRLDANGFLDADDSLAIETDQGTDEGDNTTAEIEATRQEIEQTRNNMSQTIDAIQQRLNPQALMDQAKESAHEMVEHAKDSVREATIGRAQQAVNNVVESAKDMVSDVGDSARGAGSSIVDVIQRNPIPAALAALGLGWLFMSARNDAASPAGYRRDGESAGGRRYRRGIYEFQGEQYTFVNPVDDRESRSTSSSYSSGYRGRYSDAGGSTVGRAVGQVQDRAGQVVDRIQDKAGDVADRAGDLVNRAQDRAGQMADQVQDKVGDIAGRVQDRAGDIAGRVQHKAGDIADQVQESAAQVSRQAQYQAQRAADGFDRMLEESPLSMGALFLALGAAAGMAVPATEHENRWMGDARDHLIDRAQDTVQDVAQKVQTVASGAIDSVKQEVQNQGLTDKVQNVARAAADAAKQEAQDQGLTGRTS